MLSLRLLAAFLAVAAFGSAARSDPPDACTLVTLSDVDSTLGGDWAAAPASMNVHTSDMSGCYYSKGMGNLVAFSIVRVKDGNAKKAVSKLQTNVAVKHKVAALPALCEGGFSEVLTKKNTTVYAAKGQWQVQLQVERDGAPDVERATALVKRACERL
jgi:hypothetical protein